jgi:hypothetical protein
VSARAFFLPFRNPHILQGILLLGNSFEMSFDLLDTILSALESVMITARKAAYLVEKVYYL